MDRKNESFLSSLHSTLQHYIELFHSFSVFKLNEISVTHSQTIFIITNSRKKTIICPTQQSPFSTVNTSLVNDCISTVPITSWPLMFANSSLTVCYVREVRGDVWGLSSVHFDHTSRGSCLHAFVYYCALAKSIACCQREMTLHFD